ncbi:hypothetical protein Tco_0907658 [Tanacetum coccineum]|uniref:Uncharacterized protein n=1 Tax=Tanacetum coccineum TaxID=301880 RepID=A0ABQ5CKR5_9ASTR
MKNANPSSPTPNSEFLEPKKKLEVESWIEDSKNVDPLVSSDYEFEDKIEEVKEEEEEEKDDLEYFDTFPTMEELGYHEWLLKNPRPSWVKANIRIENLNNVKFSCMIGHFVKKEAYIDLESPINDTTSVRDHYLGSVVFGKPFVEKTELIYDKEEETVLDINTNRVPPFVIEGDDDSHEKTHYTDSLNLGPEYKYDESVSEAIRVFSTGNNRIACRNFFHENECEFFTVSGDGIWIFPDDVAPPNL